mmetsp:Transcript_17880/g.49527  ORF Transcript_17880/g.49527 Transcript_17880/m.49527 type:complete len:117 (-) Transcript_17880:36-386(-)
MNESIHALHQRNNSLVQLFSVLFCPVALMLYRIAFHPTPSNPILSPHKAITTTDRGMIEFPRDPARICFTFPILSLACIPPGELATSRTNNSKHELHDATTKLYYYITTTYFTILF